MDRVNNRAKQVLHDRVVKLLRDSGYIPITESIVAVAEAVPVGAPARSQGRMWVITDRQTIVWHPHERYPVVAVGHGSDEAIASGSFDSRGRQGFYAATVADLTADRFIAKDLFVDPSPEFTAFLDGQRTTGGPYR